MSIDMDLDNEDTSGLSSVESEHQAARPSTRRTSTRQNTGAKTHGSTVASTSKVASKGKQTRRNLVTEDSNDIAVPSLDENGNLQEQPADEDGEDSESEDDDDEQDSDFRGAKTRSARGASISRGGRRGRGKAGGGRSATGRASTSAAKGTARRKTAVEVDEDGNAAEQAANGTEAARGKDDFSVEADNNLFSEQRLGQANLSPIPADEVLTDAVKDPRAAIAATVEDWLESYRADEDSRGQALADLVNFVLRCCGCNLSVDRHEAQDLDGVVSKLDDIQTDFAKVNQASYPLVSKSKGYKKFRSSLREFMTKLVETTAISEVLYDDIFCETFQSWLVALSSSKLRAFRHTSTVITLTFVEALCEVSLSNKDDFSQLQRQKEAEVKRAGKLVGKSTRAGVTDKTRLQELEALIKATHSNKMRLETYFKELFDAVFIHRYRDAEPAIRMECIRSLGVWMSTLPDHFLEGNYLRYIGWMLTDLDKTVRREAVSSLSAVYEKDDYIMSMQHFTERFKARLVEMATSDTELNIRVEAIQVLRQIDRHGLLEDEQRDQVARLIFDAEPRARRAAAIFFDSLLKENVEQKTTELQAHRAGNEPRHSAENLQHMLEWKCCASMLVIFSLQLDEEIATQLQALAVTQDENDSEDELEDSSNAESAFTRYRKNRDRAAAKLRRGNGAASIAQLTAILQGQNEDRLSLAVETLYFEVEIIRNWQSLLDYLLLDHSATQAASAAGEAQQNQVHTVCRLEDAEETVLLSVLVASVKTARERAKMLASVSDDEREELYKTTTRAIMNSLSRLFAKHQTVPTRCTTLLLLPQQMDLDLYLEIRQVTNYEQLWDDISRQFVGHSDIYLLERAMDAINVLRATQALSATNTEKASALEVAVLEPLQQLLDRIDAINATPIDEDTIQKLSSWLARLCLILKNWDVTPAVTEAGPSNAPTVLETVNQMVERGQMGFQEEEKVIQHSLDILYLCYLWQITKVGQDESTPANLTEQRNVLVQQCKDYAIGELNAASEGVKRTAFRLLLDLHITAKARFSVSEDAKDALTLSVQSQYRCAGFVQGEIERYASFFDPRSNAGDDLIDENEDHESDDPVPEVGNAALAFRPVTLAQHAATYAFNDLIVSYARAICVDVLDIHHASTMLVHYDRFGPFFNECCRWLGDAIRQFGVLGDAGHAAAGVTVESFQGALGLYISATTKSDSCFLALARHLSSHLVVRGRGFVIAARLPSEDLVKLHKELVTYTIKKYKTLANQEKHASKNKALVMFKGLVHCLIGMTGKEAAIIYAHMNETLKEHEIEVPASSRHWDGQHSYDKRLVTLMSKDAGIKVTARKTVRTRKEAIGNTSEAEDGEEENDGSQLPGRGKPKPKTLNNGDKQNKRPKATKKVSTKLNKPQALPTRRSNRSTIQEGTSIYAEGDSEGEEDDEEEEEEEEEANVPKGTNAITQSKSKRAPTPSDDDSDDEEPASAKAGTTLPARKGALKAGTKRPRAQSEEEEDEDELPPPLKPRTVSNQTDAPSLPEDDLSAISTSSRQGDSPEPAMDLSTQELAETDSLILNLANSPPGFNGQSDAGDGLPRRKRSRF